MRSPSLSIASARAPAIVVLIHGLGRTAGCWRKLASALTHAGFNSVAVDYPSTRFDIPALVDGWVGPTLSHALDKAVQHDTAVHVVTHSMGGILLRHWLQSKRLPPASRVVMLAPPNKGSEVIDRLAQLCLFRYVMGPAAAQLGASPASWVNGLPDWASEARLGIIAGNRSADPWFNRWFDGPHDGKVAVESTYLNGCHATSVLPVTHTWIMDNVRVQQWVADFLGASDFSMGGANSASSDSRP